MSKKLSPYIPEGFKPWPHELRAAKVLASAGYKVEFIMPRQNLPTADILLDGIEYEMKSPLSGNTNSLEHLLKKGLLQSHNLIIDTSRLKKTSDAQIYRFLVAQYRKREQLKRLLLINKQAKIIVITK